MQNKEKILNFVEAGILQKRKEANDDVNFLLEYTDYLISKLHRLILNAENRGVLSYFETRIEAVYSIRKIIESRKVTIALGTKLLLNLTNKINEAEDIFKHQ